MPARLSWRLLVVPRLLAAVALIAWALVRLPFAGHPPRPARHPPSAPDPVAAALRGAEDLRWIVTADELDPIDEAGHNTIITLADEVSTYADPATADLAGALAAQPGIDAVDRPDREVLLVRTRLALPDVQAAAIRALLTTGPPAGPAPEPRPPLPDVAALMTAGGFTGERGAAFRRHLPGRDLTQVIELHDGWLMAAVHEPGPDRVVLSRSWEWTPADVHRVLEREALPFCNATTSRRAIVDRWVHGLPWHVPDRLPGEAAETAERWGFFKHARDLRRYGGHQPPGPR
ncbi:hypothetical protein [Dactylosporangium matsuzakiense]|uniref:Uncharacterized protein n=1 Tax=Dactylosporangium matsuzakiense TaxID=53360 RepID=A0A9W6NQU0_9ACTN|nr:hypothetical protein [Dactylosporangium matsuzakiense]UWZ48373.1 hypothetical protein Dmats_19365 [Dactylosporangium matsuzakiense]GLL05472.1 hypothetical protein GCM10017581_072190 [Dactylosporangium matsuzakiense]